MSEPIRTRKFSTNRTWQDSLGDLSRLFDLWGIERGEWGAVKPVFPSRAAEVWYYLPYDPSRKSVSCLSQDNEATNLRQCVMTLTELQRAAVRGVAIMSGRESLLALAPGASGPSGANGAPSGSGLPPSKLRKSAFKGLREACAVLGILPDTGEQDAVDMRRIRLARFHPDTSQTHDAEAFKRVQEAWEFIRERKGWGVQGGG